MWLSDSIDVADLARNFHLNRLGNLARYSPGHHHGHVQFDVLYVVWNPTYDGSQHNHVYFLVQ